MSIAKKPPLPLLRAVTFDGETLEIQHYLTYQYEDVSEAAADIPQAVAWLNQNLQRYVAQELVDYRHVKEVEATAYFALRNGTFAEKYGEKMTEKALEYAVELDPAVIEAVALHADAKGWVSLLKGQIDLLLHRMELIRTVEATRRHVDAA